MMKRRAAALFRADVARFWPWTLLWVLLLVAQLAVHRLVPIGTEAGIPEQMLRKLAPSALLLFVALVLLLVQPFRAVGSRPFWLTRPMSSFEVLGEKVLFLVLAWGVPLLLAEAVGLSSYGAQLDHLPSHLVEAAASQIQSLALLFLVAAGTRSLWRGVLTYSGASLGLALLVVALAKFPNSNAFAWISAMAGPGPLFALVRIGTGCVLLGAAGVLLQSRRRRWAVGVVAASCLLLSWVDARGLDRVLRGSASGVPSGALAFSIASVERESIVSTPDGDYVPLKGAIGIEGLPPGTFAQVRFGEGTLETAGRGQLEVEGRRDALWVGRREALSRGLDGAILQPRFSTNPLSGVLLRADAGEVESVGALQGTLAVPVVADLIAPKVRLSLPLHPGQSLRSHEWKIEIIDVEPVLREVWVALRLRRVVPHSSELPKGTALPGADFVLLNRAEAKAFLPSPVSPAIRRGATPQGGSVFATSGGQGRSSFSGSASGERSAVLTTSPKIEAQRKVLAFPLPDYAREDGWLEDCELVVVQNRFVGSRRQKVEIEGFRIEE